ncbi:hypothetical protein HanPI659440_Chr03g0135811 [Helianthus annuus]|nr:hypothetical protein HanPI659440_Chr03g0135811 [Helianthus annuus]
MDPVLNLIVAKNQACEIENSMIRLHDEHANLNNQVVEQASNVLILLVFKMIVIKVLILFLMVQCLVITSLIFNMNLVKRSFETQRKRFKRLSEWKWSEVINLDDSEDNVKEEELEDTTDSSINQNTRLKIPRVSIQKRNGFHAVYIKSIKCFRFFFIFSCYV